MITKEFWPLPGHVKGGKRAQRPYHRGNDGVLATCPENELISGSGTVR